jgi:hypothetical protein
MGAPSAGEGRLVGAAIRCYPARWRRRHAEEAAELAALLIRDGRPAASIAGSYLLGAARERLAPRPGGSLSTVAAALLAAACLLGFSAAMVAETVPAKAAGTTQSRSGPASPKIKPASPGAGFRSRHQGTPGHLVMPRHVTGTSPVAGRGQPGIRGTAHARSC